MGVCSSALWTCKWPEQLPSLLLLRSVHASGCSAFRVRSAPPVGLLGPHQLQAYNFWPPVACCGHSLPWTALLVEAPSQVLSAGPTLAHRKHTCVLLSEETWTYGKLWSAFLEVPSNLASRGSHSELFSPQMATWWATVGTASFAVSLHSPAEWFNIYPLVLCL